MTGRADRDPHASLRDDVRLLGELLGKAVSEHEGEACFDVVERVRVLSKTARKGDVAAFDELHQLLTGLPTDEALVVARAFAQFLTLANIAEQHHRIRRRRDYQRDPGGAPQRGSLEDGFTRLLAAGVDGDTLHALVDRMRVELVFTAHPTQVNRRTILQKHNRIAAILAELDHHSLTPGERAWNIEELRREIASIWYTDELLRTRPTPVFEANSGLLIFEQTLWDAVPRFARTLDDALERHTGRGLGLERFPVVFGTWMGGDRDGNPNVTPTVTRRVCALARWMAADLYWRELDALRAELSLEAASPALQARVGADVREPYRALLGEVRERMAQTRSWAEAVVHQESAALEAPIYRTPEELREPLMLVWDSLHEVGAGIVARGRLLDILRRLTCFGLSLVRLDIRQEADRHTDALDAVTTHLGLGSYASWDETQRQAFLVAELESRRPLIPADLPCSPEVQDVLDTARVVAEQPAGSLGAYVISMATSPSDVLAVELLQREARAEHALRVVPLFETLDDLRGAREAVGQLLDLPWFRARVAERGDELEVMIGYSDSAKDAGLMMASWALYQAQEAMLEACRARGVRLTVFHGRGGTVGRGGGPSHKAVLALPPGTVDGGLRVTEQGEVIQARFGLLGIALRHLDLTLTSVAEATLLPAPEPKPEWRALLSRMAEAAKDGYRGAVRGHPDFVPYFRSVTPEPELGTLKIGSRPARRRKGGGVESLRAIPWVFAWNQTRLLLPSWLGVGEGLRAGLDSPDRETLLEMAAEWPYFRTFLSLIEMVLAKVEPEIHAHYEKLLVPEALHPLGQELRERYEATRAAVLEVRGQTELLENNHVLRRSISVRNPYVDPLNLLQAEILARSRAAADPTLEEALHVTINGVAAGMRNTG